MLHSIDMLIPIPAATNAPMPGKNPLFIGISAERNPTQLETSKVNRKDVHKRAEVIRCRISETMNANGTLEIMQERNIASIDLLFGWSINGASICEAQRVAIKIVHAIRSKMRNCGCLMKLKGIVRYVTDRMN